MNPSYYPNTKISFESQNAKKEKREIMLPFYLAHQEGQQLVPNFLATPNGIVHS